MFLHFFTFNLYLSLGLKWVSCRQPIGGSCFYFIHFYTPCLLFGAFSSFTFRVIIDRYECSAILLLVFTLVLEILSFFLSNFCCFWSSFVLKESPLIFFCRAGLVVTTFFSFWLSRKLSFSFYSEWYPCWIECSWLQIFPIQHIEKSCHSFLAHKVSLERSAVNLMGFLL